MKRAAAAAVVEARIEDLSHDARGVARVEGKALFVDGALPGERVRARLLKRRRQYDEAALEEVLEPSPDRVAPRCAHFGVCGGCALQHLAPAAQIDLKQRHLLETLERIGGVRPRAVFAPLRGPDWAYRRRARLGVRFVHKKGRVLAGFRERDKPYLADLSRCEILVERFADLPRDLAALVEGMSLRERIPQVEVAVGDAAAALVFRVMDPPTAEDLAKLEAFGAAQGAQIYLQPGGLDSVRALRDDYPPLAYRLDGGAVEIQFAPVDFIQVNAPVNAAMVERAVQLLAPEAGDTVLDLFCGLGNFTLPIARRAGRVVGVEGDAALVERARANARRNGAAQAEFHAANLFEPAGFGAWARERYARVLLDPPRAGAEQCLAHVADWRPARIVYISCHPGSLARDAGILVNTLGYELAGAGVMDMFPHTTHVESIAVFEPAA